MQHVCSGLTVYSMPKRSKSHFVAASTPGYSAETRQLRKSNTPPSVRGTSGVFAYFLLMSSLTVGATSVLSIT